jgi:predicted RNA binding protein YcfA (HicA-like mRNA interferase family)
MPTIAWAIITRVPSDARYSVAKGMLEAKGYFLDRVNGSHHIFVKAGVGSFGMPVHNAKVKHVYIKQIQRLK